MHYFSGKGCFEFLESMHYCIGILSQAASGEEIALMEILKFYESYISKLCLRPFYHENGTISMIVDEEWKGDIRTAILKAILKFDIRIK